MESGLVAVSVLLIRRMLSVVVAEAEPDEIIQILADMLRDSLWERQLRRMDSQTVAILRALVNSGF